jgi:hypothetical protein
VRHLRRFIGDPTFIVIRQQDKICPVVFALIDVNLNYKKERDFKRQCFTE